MRALPRWLIALLLAVALPLQALAAAGALPCAMHGGQSAGAAHAQPAHDATQAPCHEAAADTADASQPSSCSACKLCGTGTALPAAAVQMPAFRAATDLELPPTAAAPLPRPERLERPPRSALPA
jgi:hypothetical protein